MRRKPLTNKAGEVRELLRDDLRQFRPADQALPAGLVTALPKRRPGQRGPQKSPPKHRITLRLDRDIVDYFRATGAGWQTRINRALRHAIKTG